MNAPTARTIPTTREKIARERARRSLYEFVKQAWPIVDPGKGLIDNWHVGAICEHLQAVTAGEILRLLINIPPGHAKSLLVSVFWPAWVWINNPTWQGIFTAYADVLALRDSLKCRSLIQSDWYRANFSVPAGWELSEDQNTKGKFDNTKKGFRMARGVDGSATGFRGDAVVVDDPISAQDATSKLERDKVIYWWDVVMSTRLNFPEAGARVVIMQRLHEEDLSGHLITQGGYEHLCLPSEYDPARRSVTYHKVNGERLQFFADPRTEAGEPLFPALFTADVLSEARRILGSDGYAGQHDQNPTPPEGGMFKKKWWRFWRTEGKSETPQGWRRPEWNQDPARLLPVKLDRVIWSLDAAFKDAKKSDFVVFQVWGCVKADRYLLHQIRARMSFTKTVETARQLSEAFPKAHRKLVEDKANGPAIIDTLQGEISGLIAVNPEGGKEARASAVQPQVESGNCFLPEGAEWVEDFIGEWGRFPLGKNDDQVDCGTQALLDLTPTSDANRLRGLLTM